MLWAESPRVFFRKEFLGNISLIMNTKNKIIIKEKDLELDLSHKPLTIRDLTVSYNRKPVIWDIDLSIPKGNLVGIVGPNGAGKSTLIKACLDLVPRISGEVMIYGKNYTKERRRVGYVPQRESVDWDFPVSVLDVVAMHVRFLLLMLPLLFLKLLLVPSLLAPNPFLRAACISSGR